MFNFDIKNVNYLTMRRLIFVLSLALITLSILSCANSGLKSQNHNKSCGAYGNP